MQVLSVSMASVVRVMVTLGLLQLVQSYSTFKTTCSTPEVSTNYVSSPNTRGTLDILWSCLFTIIACTWTIQHLNLPEQREGRDPGWLGDLKWMWKGSWNTTKWILITMVAPEVILGKARGDYNDAKVDLEELQQFAEQDDIPWTLTHSLLANMGGNEINDKSKGDSMFRIITIVQISWTITQIIARGFRNLSISQVEIAVIAFAVCAVITYALNRNKPKAIHVPFTLLEYNSRVPDNVQAVLDAHPELYGWSTAFFYSADTSQLGGVPLNSDTLQSNDTLWLLIGSVAFGAIHLVAWNFAFPTEIEKYMWRVSSMCCVCAFFVSMPLIFFCVVGLLF